MHLKPDFTNTFNPITPVQPYLQKYFSFFFSEIDDILQPSCLHRRGVSRSSRTWEVGCGGREGLAACHVQADERDSCGRRNRVVLIPRRWYQVCDEASLRADDGGQKARRTKEIAYKP
jgi:hypothetical protein